VALLLLLDQRSSGAGPASDKEEAPLMLPDLAGPSATG
jgi:hypothetical protein